MRNIAIVIAVLAVGCGESVTPTSPSSTAQFVPSSAGASAPATGSFAPTGFAPRALTVARVIDLGGVNWEWNEHRNKLIPDDPVDNEGGGAPSVMQAGVDLTHVWVREAGSGLAVVDSGEDLAGAVVYLGGVQKTLTLRVIE